MNTFLKTARSFIGREAPPRANEPAPYYRQDFSDADKELVRRVEPFTMTGAERVIHLARAVEYIVHNGLPGAFVECGVWRGGSMMAVALTLERLGATDRDLCLFDTFDGMPPPDRVDVLHDGTPAADLLASSAQESLYWARAGLAEVRHNMNGTGYPQERVHYVRGKVEDTIPGQAPEAICLLRLDTDWYSSTRHELVHLYPRLSPDGVLIIDDYGWWRGARQAVDEYFAASTFAPLLHRLDESGRACIKK